MLNGKTVVIGITGGIAVYKVANVVRGLQKLGADVHCIMTKNATEFVTPLTFETLSHNAVIYDMFNRTTPWEVEHISLAQKADLLLIAPATANVIGKLANGIADDFLTTTAMACVAPLIIAPAMNCNMFNSVAFQHNLQVLTERGAKAIFGSSGYLACGDIGAGRMAEPNEIVDFVAKILTPNNDYNGKRVLITCGATSEKLDDVRVITNFSSGKTGMALAERVIARGGSVTLILGNHTAPAVKGAEVVEVTTTEDMYNATLSRVSSHDIFIMSAAPADYRPLVISPTKIKGDSVTINLVKNRDIAEAVGANKGNKIMVAFSAETDNLIDNAKSKLINKHADFIVANDITRAGAGFGIDTNIISIVDKDSVVSYDIMSKIEVADIILDKVLKI